MTNIANVGGLALTVILTAVLLPQGGTSASAQQVPKGAVMAFRLAKCPAGWNPAPDLAGRVVVGAGEGQKDQNNKPLTKRALGQTGGEEMHTLSVTEMPKHSHSAQGYGGGDRAANQGGQGDVLYAANNNPTGTTGGDQPHNVMQPYLVLTYCEKK
jgi:microcystin-dependent protein